MPVVCPVTEGCKGDWDSTGGGQPTPAGECHFKRASQRKEEGEFGRQKELSESQAKECRRENMAHSRNFKWSARAKRMVFELENVERRGRRSR